MSNLERYCRAWLRAHAPDSDVLRLFPAPVPLERAEVDELRHAQLDHARRVAALLEGRA